MNHVSLTHYKAVPWADINMQGLYFKLQAEIFNDAILAFSWEVSANEKVVAYIVSHS